MQAQATGNLETREEWTAFLSAFVHELRTPIASLLMLADLLDGDDRALDEQGRRYTRNIKEVAHDVQGLVGDAGELARLLAGRVPARREVVDAAGIVERAQEAVRTRAWERGVTLAVTAAHDVPPVATDAARLEELLVLLLSAAVAQATARVTLTARPRDGGVLFTVRGDGTPLPEPAESVFEPFQSRVRSPRQRGGRSLGLPVARELARLLDARLTARNDDGEPRFELALPAAP